MQNERQQVDTLLAQIRQVYAVTLTTLSDVTEAEFALPTDLKRWDELRRVWNIF